MGHQILRLTQNQETLVDNETFIWASNYKWLNNKKKNKFYAIRRQNKKTIYLHREIMNAQKGQYVDHINGNSLDNRKTNLRICSNAENSRNSKTKSNNTSGYKGVVWLKRERKWRSRIKVNYKLIVIGYYNDIKEAAKAYNQAAKEYFGEYAWLNIIKD